MIRLKSSQKYLPCCIKSGQKLKEYIQQVLLKVILLSKVLVVIITS